MTKYFLSILLLLFPLAALSQNNEPYTTEDGLLTFEYPPDWFITEGADGVAIATREEALGKNAGQLEGEESLISLATFPADQLAQELETVTARGALEAVLSLFDDATLPVSFSPTKEVTLGKYNTALVKALTEGDAGQPVHLLILVADLDGEQFLFLIGSSAARRNLMDSTAIRLMESLIYNGGAASPGSHMAGFFASDYPFLQTQTYITPDGNITLDYPAGWVVRASPQGIRFASSPDEMQILIDTFAPSEISPASPPDMAEMMTFFMQGIAQDGDAPVFSQPQTMQSGAYSALVTVGKLDATNMVLMLVELAEDEFFYLAGSGDVAILEIAMQMIASMTYAPTLDVVWHIQRSTSAPDGFGEFYQLAQGANGTFYVAQGFRGIQEFDADGNLLRHLQPPEMSIVDVAADPNGILYVIDEMTQQPYVLESDGSDRFGENGRYRQIELGPDGNIYTYAVMTPENGESTGVVQIWTPDGELVREFRANNASEGFTYFTRMKVAADGKIYLADLIDGIRVFSADGTLLVDDFLGEVFPSRSFTAIDVTSGYLALATKDGNIYVVSLDGNLIREYGKRQPVAGTPGEPGELAETVGLVLLPSGDVIAADTNFSYSRILRFSLSGL